MRSTGIPLSACDSLNLHTARMLLMAFGHLLKRALFFHIPLHESTWRTVDMSVPKLQQPSQQSRPTARLAHGDKESAAQPQGGFLSFDPLAHSEAVLLPVLWH